MSGKTSPFYTGLLDAVGRESNSASQRIYLVTMSRVLPGAAGSPEYRNLEDLTRQNVGDMVRDAFENPLPSTAGGRPRVAEQGRALVEMMAVAKEPHADGSHHFHVAMKLGHRMSFSRAKATLKERHQLPSHFSSKHTQLWSAVRYIHVATHAKPRVDTDIWTWTHDGSDVDLTEKAREPFMAVAWRKKRESVEARALVEDTKAPSFNKLDLMALVLSKHLHTKTQLLAYIQAHGSPAAQLFVTRQQRRLAEFIDDAQEWAGAKSEVVVENMTEWEILCKAKESPCPHAPGCCSYATAVSEIFHLNAAVLSPQRLAAALSAVIRNGPSKTCRVPFLVGPSNTGKSTLLYPFDDLFGPKQVVHKPALGSTFALRNIVNKKRFILWDDFRPVEFAHKDTIPVATFLSLFIGKDTEIQVSQSFHDGNLDVRWKRGVVFTAKEEGLWEATSKVLAEDVRHLRNRVEEFRFDQVVRSLKDVESCAPCMARWILKYAEEAAYGSVPAPLQQPSSHAADASRLGGFADLMAAAKMTGPVVSDLLGEAIAVGAIDVEELALQDWQALPSWGSLRPLEVRRLGMALSKRAAISVA